MGAVDVPVVLGGDPLVLMFKILTTLQLFRNVTLWISH